MKHDNNAAGRRDFLIKSAVFFMGSTLGFNSFSKTFAETCSKKKPRIALIIDDIGFSETRLDSFLEIGAPLTFSILPKLPMSAQLAEKIHREGHEVMLHQPMEPMDPFVDPGPGALYVNDSPEKITEKVRENISETPFATGINNHMGSKFTACGKEMKKALAAVREKGLFFIDSLTTSSSTGYSTARTMHISAFRRNVFIDNVQDEDFINHQLVKLKWLALKHGQAIGIGHPFPETSNAAARFYRKLKTSNFSMVPISRLL